MRADEHPSATWHLLLLCLTLSLKHTSPVIDGIKERHFCWFHLKAEKKKTNQPFPIKWLHFDTIKAELIKTLMFSMEKTCWYDLDLPQLPKQTLENDKDQGHGLKWRNHQKRSKRERSCTVKPIWLMVSKHINPPLTAQLLLC